MIPLRDNIPSKTTPFVLWSLIAVNCYVFYLQLTAGGPEGFERFVNHWAVIPAHLYSNPHKYWFTLITAAFVHGGWMHIIGNMIFLYIFGHSVEDRMGHFKFLVFYLLIGALANGSQTLIAQTSKIPLIGASGAIAGVLGAYFFYYPYARILTVVPIFFFIRIIEIPAFIFLGFWFLMQAMDTTISFSSQLAHHQDVGGIAFLAHAVGFVAGLILGPFFGDKRSRFK
jgi:membrane associated rhomboid family serine protease